MRYVKAVRCKVAMTTVLALGLVNGVDADQCDLRGNASRIFISDTHMGMGGRCEGDNCNSGWHKMEDFRWHDEFDDFTVAFSEGEAGPIDLIIVGDALELWQEIDKGSPCGTGETLGSNIGCNSDQAINRLNRVEAAHGPFFETMEKFLAEGSNRLIVLPGNHDAALAMNAVSDRFLSFFDDGVKANVCIDSDGILVYSDGAKTRLVEHGHQVHGDVNRYDNSGEGVVSCIDDSEASVDCNGEGAYIVRTWGENFVQNYYNDYELMLPVIDNYSSEPSGVPDGIKRGYAAASDEERQEAIAEFLAFFFTQQTAAHLLAGLGSEEPEKAITQICSSDMTDPCLDVAAMKDFTITSALFSELPDGRGDLIAYSYTVPGKAAPTIEEIYSQYPEARADIDDMLIASCLYWKHQAEPEVQCAYENLGLGAVAVGVSNWFRKRLNKDFDHIEQHVEGREEELDTDIDYFIYGHTHVARQYANADKSLGILNTGAWQRVASARVIGAIIEECANSPNKTEDSCFREMSPSELPACYSFVVDTNSDGPMLRWWAKSSLADNAQYHVYAHGGQPSHCKP